MNIFPHLHSFSYHYFTKMFESFRHADIMTFDLLYFSTFTLGTFQVVQLWRICLPMQEIQKTQIQFLGWKDPLEKEMATHSNILVWKIPWPEEPGGLESIGSQRVRQDWATELESTTYTPRTRIVPATPPPPWSRTQLSITLGIYLSNIFVSF